MTSLAHATTATATIVVIITPEARLLICLGLDPASIRRASSLKPLDYFIAGSSGADRRKKHPTVARTGGQRLRERQQIPLCARLSIIRTGESE